MKFTISDLKELPRKLKDYALSGLEKTRVVLRDTLIEIAVLGVTGAILGGVFTYHLDSMRKVPLAFSEISQLEREAEDSGKPLGPINQFLPKLSDCNNKIVEARNIAGELLQGSNRRELFARELENKLHMDHHHYSLTKLLDILPELSQRAIGATGDLKFVAPRMDPVISELEDTWTESHTDHYRTEHRTRTVRDSKGNTKTEHYTERVYDHTTHSYTFHPDHAKNVISHINLLLSEKPKITWPEELRKVKKTNADGEMAAEVSRQKKGQYLKLTQGELLEIANSWNTGSTYNRNKPGILNSYNNLKEHAALIQAVRTMFEHKWSNTISYNTRSRWDSGPKEYRLTEAALRDSRQVRENIYEIISGFAKVANDIPKLKADVEEYTAVVLDRQSGNAAKLERRIMRTVSDLQKANFNAGIDLSFVRSYMVLIGILAGAALGGFAGAGVNYVAEKRKWWDRRTLRNFSDY